MYCSRRSRWPGSTSFKKITVLSLPRCLNSCLKYGEQILRTSLCAWKNFVPAARVTSVYSSSSHSSAAPRRNDCGGHSILIKILHSFSPGFHSWKDVCRRWPTVRSHSEIVKECCHWFIVRQEAMSLVRHKTNQFPYFVRYCSQVALYRVFYFISYRLKICVYFVTEAGVCIKCIYLLND